MIRPLPKLAAQRRLPQLLWLSGAGVIGLVAALLVLLLLHLRNAELDNARRELGALATAVASMVDRYLDTHQVALNAAASLAAGYEADPIEIRGAVAELRIGAPALRALEFLDPSGRPLDQPTPPLLRPETVAQRPHLVDTGLPILEPPHQDPAGNWRVRMVLALADRRIGWVIGELDMDALDALLADIDLGEQGMAVVLHSAGRIVARQRDSSRFRTVDLSDFEIFTTHAAALKGAALQRERLDGVQRMTAFERLPQYQLVIAVGRGYDEIMSGWWRIVLVSALTLVLLASSILLAIALILRAWSATVSAVTELGVKEERLSAVQEIAELGLWEYDSDSEQLIWSAEVERLLELTAKPGNNRYQTLMDSVHPDDRDGIDARIRAAESERTPLDLELRVPRQDGRIRHLRLRARARVDRRGARVLTGTLLDVTDATQAQERLALAEAQYRYLFELSPVPLWVFDLTSQRFVAVNQAAIELYGWSPLQFLTMTLDDLRAADEPEGGPGLADPELENGLIWRHLTADQRVVHVRVYGTPVSFEGREARLIASIDVTDKVRAENELADSEARFRLVARVSNDAIYDFDTRHNSLWWSDSYYHHFGADPSLDDSDIDTWSERIHPDDRERVVRSFDASMTSAGDDWEASYRYRRRDGGYAHVQDRGYILRDDAGRALRMVGGMLDRSPELQAQQALAERENSYRGLIEGLPLPLIVLRDGVVAFANPSAGIALQDGPGQNLVGRNAEAIFDPALVAMLRGSGWSAAGRQVQVHRPDGSLFLAEISLSAYRDRSGDGVQMVLRDLTEQIRFEQILTHQAQHDELTGLPNRRALKERLRAGLAALVERGGELATIFVDLDQFKVINDALGHAIGDNVIRTVAERLQSEIDPEATLGRFGGDEFMLLADADRADGLIRSVREAVAQPIEVQGTTQFLTASIGVAIGPRDGTDADTLIRSADAAMYEAKRQGRNRAVMYSDVLHRSASNRLELVSRLRQSELGNELALYWQSQHEAQTRDISGVELLLRWPNGPAALRLPSRFIPICEDTGLMVPIGRWVLRQACQRQPQIAAMVGKPCRIAVNVSAQQFIHDDLVAEVGNILSETGMDGRLLELEITESVILADPGGIVRTIEGLRGLGVEVAIDDFGSGYSNLGYLSRLPVSTLKIDRSFVRDVLVDRQQEAICASIIALAHSLSLRVVAEGVETQAQCDWLVAHDCDHLQGYLFSQPRPFPDEHRLPVAS